jgi:hypothetical protein
VISFHRVHARLTVPELLPAFYITSQDIKVHLEVSGSEKVGLTDYESKCRDTRRNPGGQDDCGSLRCVHWKAYTLSCGGSCPGEGETDCYCLETAAIMLSAEVELNPPGIWLSISTNGEMAASSPVLKCRTPVGLKRRY